MDSDTIDLVVGPALMQLAEMSKQGVKCLIAEDVLTRALSSFLDIELGAVVGSTVKLKLRTKPVTAVLFRSDGAMARADLHQRAEGYFVLIFKGKNIDHPWD